MVEVRGYIRSGNCVFWQTPSGKLMRVGCSRLVGAYPKIIKQFGKEKEGQKVFKINFKHKLQDIRDSVLIPAFTAKQAEAYFLSLNGTNYKITSTKVEA
jgi:hypothetical protein